MKTNQSNNGTKKQLSHEQLKELFSLLKTRFEKNKSRHVGIEWEAVQIKIKVDDDKLWSLNEMEKTGGEPEVVGFDKATGEFLFYYCSAESPKGLRSICCDQKALESRKEFKPEDSALNMADEMGIQLLNEKQYRYLHKLGNFDTKTSGWIVTPPEIRKLGGALF